MNNGESAVKRPAGSGLRFLISLACVVVVAFGLKAASPFFTPIILGFFLALMSLPILEWLHRMGLPRPLAVMMTIVVDMLILGAIVFITSGVVGSFQDRSGFYAEKLRRQASEFSAAMDEQLERLGDFWSRTGENIMRETDPPAPPPEEPAPETAPPPDAEEVREPPGTEREPRSTVYGPDDELDDEPLLDTPIPTFQELFERYWDTGRVVNFIGQIDLVGRFTSLASQTFFALIVMIFVLAESGRFAHKVQDVLRERGPDLTRFRRSARDIQKYLGIKTFVSFLTGILAMVVCFLFRIDFPLLWGMVAFLFNYVPAIGSILASIPPVILALILHGFWPAAGVLGCYLLINVSIGNFLEPTLLGDRFGLSTVVVIFSVLFWGFVWGPLGMLLAVPLTMMVKVMLDNSSDLRWISAFMGTGKGEEIVEGEKAPGPEEGGPGDGEGGDEGAVESAT